jgi:hypothetical protein
MDVIWLGALTLSAGIGVIDHQGWVDSYGKHLGKVEISQSIVANKTFSLNLAGEHWSSIDTSEDKGANALLMEISVRLR